MNDDDEEEEETEDEEAESQPNEAAEAEDDSSDDENCDRCPICLNRLKQQDVGMPESCDHLFCLECIQEWSKVSVWNNNGSVTKSQIQSLK